MKEKSVKLDLWQRRLKEANDEWDISVMDEREDIYKGRDSIIKPFEDYPYSKTPHVQNIVFENIEAEVSSNVPMPKVSPIHEEDEHLAQIIEHYLRNELDRLPFEKINDAAERTVPIQGGTFYLIDWDETRCTHDTCGATTVQLIHPKQLAPQPGVYEIEDMDWVIVKIPTTKEAIKRKYGISVEDESEAEPEVRSSESESGDTDNVTQYIGFARSDNGIDRYVWVNDAELEDIEDYQARRQPVCKKCGRMRPLKGQIINNSVQTRPQMNEIDKADIRGRIAAQMMQDSLADSYSADDTGENGELMPNVNYSSKTEEPEEYDGGACPWCGSNEFTDEAQEFEEVYLPMQTKGGVSIPGARPDIVDGEAAMVPTKIPYYKPGFYPLIVQRNVSTFGKLLGSSDVDAIQSQQNTLNILNEKIIRRLFRAGTKSTLPDRTDIDLNPHDEAWRIKNAADMNLIRTYDFSGNLQYELNYRALVYEEARNILGITDSFQGRRDTTAQSGKAKEIAAAQSAGRLESKRVMKDAAYQDIFRQMFHYALAYSDEPRPVSYYDENGDKKYEEFNRYDFLKQDESTGEYYWNDEFVFSVDTSTPLATNREQMWQECRENLASGAYGNPQSLDTLMIFWSRMDELHYPGAKSTKDHISKQIEMQQQQAAMMPPMPGAAVPGAETVPGAGMTPMM